MKKNLCHYGCGNKAIKKFKYTGNWCCSNSANNCPAVKKRKEQSYLEKYGVSNPMKSPEILKSFCKNVDWNERNKKLKKTVQNRYGVDNIFQYELVKRRIAKENPGNSKEALEKKRNTRIKNGFQVPDEKLTDWECYKRKVYNVTRKTWRENKILIENHEQKRGRTDYHLDHIYSIYDGFLNDVDPEIIGNYNNLRLLYYKENCSKRVKSDITLEELYKRCKGD